MRTATPSMAWWMTAPSAWTPPGARGPAAETPGGPVCQDGGPGGPAGAGRQGYRGISGNRSALCHSAPRLAVR